MKEILENEDLEQVAGGSAAQDSMYNLSFYAYRTVAVPAGTLLVMQEKPRGAFMSTYYTNGEPILVNTHYTNNGYLLAYKNGVYGFVDMQYVI